MPFTAYQVEDFLSSCDYKNNYFTDKFLEYRAPVYQIDLACRPGQGGRRKIASNPCLNDLEFYRVADPSQAYQEISMYISGVLGQPDPKIVYLTDKEKIQKKGFNKWSFRREKGT
jgi:hypothetical protein